MQWRHALFASHDMNRNERANRPWRRPTLLQCWPAVRSGSIGVKADSHHATRRDATQLNITVLFTSRRRIHTKRRDSSELFRWDALRCVAPQPCSHQKTRRFSCVASFDVNTLTTRDDQFSPVFQILNNSVFDHLSCVHNKKTQPDYSRVQSWPSFTSSPVNLLYRK